MFEGLEYGVDYASYTIPLINKMYETRFLGIPASFYLLDLRKINSYCHLASNMLVYCMKDGIRVTGDISTIIGDDKSHSWVEKDDKVYEVTKGLMWDKDVFYNRYKPINIEKHNYEDTMLELETSGLFKRNESPIEMYIAWILDIKDNLNTLLYRKCLEKQIVDFSKEKNLQTTQYNEAEVKRYINNLHDLYNHIEEFIKKT